MFTHVEFSLLTVERSVEASSEGHRCTIDICRDDVELDCVKKERPVPGLGDVNVDRDVTSE